MKRNPIILILLLFSNFAFSQIEKKISIEHYFNVVDSLEFNKLKQNGIIDKNNKIANEYKEKDSETLNEKGFEKLANIRADVYMNYYKDYLLLQSIEYENEVYSLYFSVAGFDDVEFQILKCKKENWTENENVDKRSIYEHNNQVFEKIAFNYDEGPKNLENPRIFIDKHYLVMERSGLYYSLYDLTTNKLLINDESPWNSAEDNSEEGLNKWIKTNLHDKIKAILEK
jgi:hypothetical protein